jgi:LEA14-like dessication related protein
MEPPVFNTISNVRMGKMGIGQSTITLDMQYFNPNHSKAKLKHAEGDTWLDSTFLGHFHVDTAISIPANSNFTVPVQLDVDMKYILKYAAAGFQSNQDVLITIKGNARAGKGGFYKNIPLNYEGRQNLSKLFSTNPLLNLQGK